MKMNTYLELALRHKETLNIVCDNMKGKGGPAKFSNPDCIFSQNVQ